MKWVIPFILTLFKELQDYAYSDYKIFVAEVLLHAMSAY